MWVFVLALLVLTIVVVRAVDSDESPADEPSTPGTIEELRIAPSDRGTRYDRERFGDGWIDADRARYRGGAMTPMDHGYVASSDGDVTYDEMKRRVLARAKVGEP